ncbi:MAG: TonB-dependent receptor [Crocosphaera sp.]|nr:TonB-dependent receptor [Crocosphaera sp.]
MKPTKLAFCLWISSIVSILVTFSVSSEPFPATINHQERELQPNPIFNSRSLRATTDLLSQAPISIIGVQINSTETETNLVVETAGGETLETSISTDGNNLIIDIPNAQLQLPTGTDFRAENPAEGIATITVTAPDANRVQVTVTGIDGLPFGDIIQTQQGLILSIIPPAPEVEIIVTAQKKPENIQEVPISITVITEQEIDDADITSLSRISGLTPNFSTFTPNRNFMIYSMRGLTNFNFLSRDPVAFYVDDVPYDYTGFLDLDLPDLERVEVLRGPQATLYGRYAQAGVVNIVTRKPSEKLEFNSNVGYGSFDSPDIRAGVGGTLVEDQLFFRLSGSYQSRDGYIYNTFLDNTVDNQAGGTGRAQLLWTPSEDWEISLNAYFDDYGGGVPLNLLGEDRFNVSQEFDGFNDLNSDTQSLKVVYNHPSFRFTSISSRRFSDQEFESDTDISTQDLLTQVGAFDSTVYSQEIRFQSPETARQFEWLVGGYFESRDFNVGSDAFRFGSDSVLLGFTPGLNQVSAEINDNIRSFFAQATYRPIDPLALRVGLRYESFNSTLEDRQRAFILPDDAGSIISGQFNDIEKNSDFVLPRFVVEYNFNPDVMIYGSVTRGYKSPGVNYRADLEPLLIYEAEKSWNYEIGLKSAWFNNRLVANLSVFHNPVEDYQVPVPDVTGFFGDIANANVDITGLELELRATPVDGFDIIAGFGYVDAYFTDYTNPFTGSNFDGNNLTYSPDFTYNLALQYRAPFGLFTRLEVQGTGTTYFNETNDLSQGSFAILNLRLGYEFSNYGIYFFGNNITEVQNLVTAASFPPFGTFVTYGAPATYGVQFRTKF